MHDDTDYRTLRREDLPHDSLNKPTRYVDIKYKNAMIIFN